MGEERESTEALAERLVLGCSEQGLPHPLALETLGHVEARHHEEVTACRSPGGDRHGHAVEEAGLLLSHAPDQRTHPGVVIRPQPGDAALSARVDLGRLVTMRAGPDEVLIGRLHLANHDIRHGRTVAGRPFLATSGRPPRGGIRDSPLLRRRPRENARGGCVSPYSWPPLLRSRPGWASPPRCGTACSCSWPSEPSPGSSIGGRRRFGRRPPSRSRGPWERGCGGSSWSGFGQSRQPRYPVAGHPPHPDLRGVPDPLAPVPDPARRGLRRRLRAARASAARPARSTPRSRTGRRSSSSSAAPLPPCGGSSSGPRATTIATPPAATTHEAYVILGLIAFLMLADAFYEGSGIVAAGEASPATAAMPLASAAAAAPRARLAGRARPPPHRGLLDPQHRAARSSSATSRSRSTSTSSRRSPTSILSKLPAGRVA